MLISVETPVFKGLRLERCIESVLHQSSPDWHLSLLWDGGDARSREILEELERRELPSVTVHFGPNLGIARARRFLSEHSHGDYILPLDDDDSLPFHAIERFAAAAAARPWASVIRARREIVDEEGRILSERPWFPFEARHYQDGMVTDVHNHSQPTLISRAAYDRTAGWEGFEDFSYAGEDCDLYLKLEEVGTVELIDEMLYYYRVHDERASLVLTDQAAFEMWRRLADRTIERIGLPLRRTGEHPPFEYERLERPVPSPDAVDFVVMGDGGAAAALARAGVKDDALTVVDGGAEAMAKGCQAMRRPLVCFVDGMLGLDGAADWTALLDALVQEELDLAAPRIMTADGAVTCGAPGFDSERWPVMATDPAHAESRERRAPWLHERLLLVRREVLAAVGGLDDGFEGQRGAAIDLCLRARQRGFRCGYIGDLAFIGPAPHEGPLSAADRERLHSKWAAAPALLGGAEGGAQFAG
ncbi:MAG TPA: glycosyltransferase [Planctomycetota bacterium]|nr:glycosyltransferase [Planctomycetota bacterium]